MEADEALAAGDEGEEGRPQRMVGRQIAAGEEDDRVIGRQRGRVEARRIRAQVDREQAVARLGDRGHRGACVHPRGMVVGARSDVVEIQDALLGFGRRGERQARDRGRHHAESDQAVAHAH